MIERCHSTACTYLQGSGRSMTRTVQLVLYGCRDREEENVVLQACQQRFFGGSACASAWVMCVGHVRVRVRGHVRVRVRMRWYTHPGVCPLLGTESLLPDRRILLNRVAAFIRGAPAGVRNGVALHHRCKGGGVCPRWGQSIAQERKRGEMGF